MLKFKLTNAINKRTERCVFSTVQVAMDSLFDFLHWFSSQQGNQRLLVQVATDSLFDFLHWSSSQQEINDFCQPGANENSYILTKLFLSIFIIFISPS
jgi:hypothetical protein